MKSVNRLLKISIVAILFSGTAAATAAQLSTDAHSAIPHDVQQLLVADYKAIRKKAWLH